MTDFLTVNEAAKVAGVGRRTIYNWIYRGLVRAFENPAGKIRLLRVDLENKPRQARVSVGR